MRTTPVLGILAFVLVLCPLPVGATAISIDSNFNATSIPPPDSTIWFNAHLKNFPNEAGSLLFTNQQVFVNDPTPGQDRTYSVPDSTVA
jgi:hypothetical protein